MPDDPSNPISILRISMAALTNSQTRRDEVTTEARNVCCLQNLTAKQEQGRKGSP